MAASVGLTPRQHSSGGKDRLLGISKPSDAYLRRILIHGARSVIAQAEHKEARGDTFLSTGNMERGRGRAERLVVLQQFHDYRRLGRDFK